MFNGVCRSGLALINSKHEFWPLRWEHNILVQENEDSSDSQKVYEDWLVTGQKVFIKKAVDL